MALPAAGVLEIRSGGSATNGAGFVAGGAGTDWSQQLLPQYSVSDGVANGTTTLASATAAFGTDVVDNYVSVSNGTGSITQTWKRIVSRTNATTIVVDSATGLTAGTGVVLKIGGALASPANLSTSNLVAGNTVWIKKSSGYTTAATITFSVDSGDGLVVSYQGYDAVRGDGGLAVLTCTNAAATSVLTVSGKGSIIRNLKIDGASLSLRCFNVTDITVTLDNCWALGATQIGFRGASTQTYFRRCLATGNGSTAAHAGFSVDTGSAILDRCVARANGGNGFIALTAGVANCFHCIASGNTLSGFNSNDNESVLRLLSCTAYGNTLDGARFAAASTLVGVLVANSVFYGNSGFGMRSITTDYSAYANLVTLFENNAFGSNTLGARYQVPTGAADITLTADPFLDAAALDFGLNLTLGGGLSLRGAGVPGTSGFGLRSSPEPSDASTDVGAVSSSGMATTGTSSATTIATMRQKFRKWTGEVYSAVLSDDEIDDVWIQSGLRDLSRRIRYHYTDDTTGVVLVAGTQEYSLPEACNELIHVYLSGQKLRKSSVEEWNTHSIPWRQQSGTPSEWAMYGEKIVFFPKPDAAAVAADDNPELRYVSDPRAFSTYGPEQLRSQDWDIPVYRAVALWSASYPDSAAAQVRQAKFDKLFDDEAALVGAYYEARNLQ